MSSKVLKMNKVLFLQKDGSSENIKSNFIIIQIIPTHNIMVTIHRVHVVV